MKVVRGLFFDNGPSNSYKVDDLKIVAYNIGEDFENFKLAKINGENPAKCAGLQPLELFTYDEDLFEETGEIALYLDKDNQYDGLGSYPNLLILRKAASFKILTLRPSTNIICSLTNADNVRMALDVVIFDKLARSSRDI